MSWGHVPHSNGLLVEPCLPHVATVHFADRNMRSSVPRCSLRVLASTCGLRHGQDGDSFFVCHRPLLFVCERWTPGCERKRHTYAHCLVVGSSINRCFLPQPDTDGHAYYSLAQHAKFFPGAALQRKVPDDFFCRLSRSIFSVGCSDDCRLSNHVSAFEATVHRSGRCILDDGLRTAFQNMVPLSEIEVVGIFCAEEYIHEFAL